MTKTETKTANDLFYQSELYKKLDFEDVLYVRELLSMEYGHGFIDGHNFA